MGVLAALLGLLVVLALLAVVLVLPIVAFVRTLRLGEMGVRIEQLETEVGRLRRRVRDLDEVEVPVAVNAEVVDAQPVVSEAVRVPSEPAPSRAKAPVVPASAHRPGSSADAWSLESWLGRQALGWVAVILLLLATAFFLKYAFENEWIGKLGRVSLGVVAGAGLCVGGYYCHRTGRRLFSQMLTGAGVALLYLSTFSAFGYYDILPQERAGIYLVVLVVQAAGLAVLYDAPAVAVMALLGGLLTPVLMQADHDQYQSLFLYLVVLNLGVVGLALFRRWSFLAPVALVGTQTLFWVWYADHYHPDKMGAALLFQGAVFSLFLLHDTLFPLLRGDRASWIGLTELAGNAFSVALAGYVLLNEDYSRLLPLGAVGLGILFASLGWLRFSRRLEDPLLVLVLTANSLAFLAIAVALRGEAGWIALGWAVEGLALAWFGVRTRSVVLRSLGGAFLALAVWHLLILDTPWGGRPPFVFLLNSYALPALVIAGCVIGVAVAYRRLMPDAKGLDLQARWVLGLAGVLLIWTVLSFEIYQSLLTRIPPADSWVGEKPGMAYDYATESLAARAALSVFWAVYAAAVMAVGFWLSHKPLRALALLLFGLTLGKVILIDMADLSGFYRVVAFFVLSLMMGAAAWGYQRLGRPALSTLEVKS